MADQAARNEVPKSLSNVRSPLNKVQGAPLLGRVRRILNDNHLQPSTGYSFGQSVRYSEVYSALTDH